jgi:hypothetical protein
MDGFFLARIADVATTGPDEAPPPQLEELRSLGLAPLDHYVELVSLYLLRTESRRVVDLVDSLAQKNRRGGFMRQLAARGAARWLILDAHLVETLAQIAVVERSGGSVRVRTVIIDEFVDSLRERYGFDIYAPAHSHVPPEQHEAWRENLVAFRERLHEIGFFVDLSDAYNSQTLRPRYEVSSV